ncbi:phosphate-starvation-inducible PsiE family protein [Flexistipes sp.]|uniref:phosphate-starvation-inducible PsiE family protein n=1 Tax=Flexistipes sp. TaxID=3088135 RepID=UPI002E1A41E4|nr:phosphate-starvation-inducible PsiE family protein [Flexistipes sp.]
MKYYRNIVRNYDVKESDLKELGSIWEQMSKYSDEFAADMSAFVVKNFKLPETYSTEITDEYKAMLGKLYERVLSGRFNNDYVSFLIKFSEFNLAYSINQEMVNSLISYARSWIHEKIFQNIPDDFQRKGILMMFHKIMDITGDIIISTYYEDIIKKYSKVFSLKNFIVDISERFSLFMHFILVAILIFLTIAATIFFGYDSLGLLSKNTEHVLITSLGSLLIIWVLVELLHTEIQIIKGGKFKISIFVGVALIAFVRDLLILTLKQETDSITTYFVLASIMVLGLIYWLIARQEQQGTRRSIK